MIVVQMLPDNQMRIKRITHECAVYERRDENIKESPHMDRVDDRGTDGKGGRKDTGDSQNKLLGKVFKTEGKQRLMKRKITRNENRIDFQRKLSADLHK